VGYELYVLHLKRPAGSCLITHKIVFEMTYNVSSGTLNPPYHTLPLFAFD